MSELRWALLSIGLLILAGIYFYHQWKARSEVSQLFSDDSGSDKDVLLDDEMIEEDITALNIGSEQHANTVGSTNHVNTHTSTTEIDPLEDPLATMGGTNSGVDATEKEAPRLEPDLFSNQPGKTASSDVSRSPSMVERLTMVVMHIVAEKDNPFEGKAVIKALQAHKLRFGEHEIFHRLLEEEGKKLTIYSVANMVKPGTLAPDTLKESSVPGLTLILNLPAPIESLKAYDDMLHAAQHMSSTLDGSLLDEEFMTLSREKIALDRAKLF